MSESMNTLIFVRMATEEDIEEGDVDISAGWSLWRQDGRNGDHYWLAPEDVMRHGLTDRMRDALRNSGQVGPIRVSVSDDEQLVGRRVPIAPPAPSRPPIEAIGGRSEKWKWDRVVDGDETFWCISNRPAIDAWEKSGREGACPALERVTLPVEIVHLIAKA